jgi:hypothetical protein
MIAEGDFPDDLRIARLGDDVLEADAGACFLEGDPAKMPEEIAEAKSPKLSIGDGVHSVRFLLPHEFRDRVILDTTQIDGSDFATVASGACLLEPRRTQETTDVLGAKRHRLHCALPVGSLKHGRMNNGRLPAFAQGRQAGSGMAKIDSGRTSETLTSRYHINPLNGILRGCIYRCVSRTRATRRK